VDSESDGDTTVNAILECLANVSEGRDETLLADLTAVVASAGARVIDLQADAEQHRAILRFAGRPAVVRRAALALAAVAAKRIDMRRHQGSHPRIGAVDLLPLVPVAGMTLDDVVDQARGLAQELAEQLDLPVYLAGDAALQPTRGDVASLRVGEYEGLATAIGTDASRAPDFGHRALGSAGACIVSARPPRLHCLVEVEGLDAEGRQALAATLDSRTGSLLGAECRVHGDDPDKALLALTLLDPERLPLHRMLDWAATEAGAMGGRLTGLRLLGLVPRSVLDQAAARQLRLVAPPRIIEALLAADEAHEPRTAIAPLGDFLDRLSSAQATPGGGSVAAVAGALCAALTAMVAGLTVGRERFAADEARMVALRGRAEALRARLEALVQADAEAFAAVMEAYQRPKDGASEAMLRREAIQNALRTATQVPLDSLEAVVEAMAAAQEAAAHGNPSAASDAGVAGYIGLAAARAAALNVEINVLGLRDLEEGDRLRKLAMAKVREAEAAADDIERRIRARIAGGA
jgi:glutamate formiminotransferase/formiminotetrahydrofolate cyclodeaminase